MKVLVIGGGIGGLTGALALQQKGMDVHLYEAADALRAVGSGIWMSPNSIKVMEYLGIAEQFKKSSIEMQRVAIEDEKGGILGETDLVRAKHRHGSSIHSVRRQTLHDILARGIESSRIHTGHKFESLEQKSDGVVVRFANGREEKCDVLIGSDGLRSSVREVVNPGVRLRYSGQSCWYGLSDAKLSDHRRYMTTEIWMGSLRFGFTEVDDGQVYFFAVEKSPANQKYDGDRAEYLRKLYRNGPEIVKNVLDKAQHDRIIKSDLNDIRPFQPLAHGRVALTGDAGHATTPNLGQGAAQAMEDAVLLAHLLSGGPPVDAIKKYESMRKDRIRYIVNSSWRLGRLAHTEGPVRRRLLYSVMRFTPESINQKLFDRVFTPTFPV